MDGVADASMGTTVWFAPSVDNLPISSRTFASRTHRDEVQHRVHGFLQQHPPGLSLYRAVRQQWWDLSGRYQVVRSVPGISVRYLLHRQLRSGQGGPQRGPHDSAGHPRPSADPGNGHRGLQIVRRSLRPFWSKNTHTFPGKARSSEYLGSSTIYRSSVKIPDMYSFRIH